VSGSVRRAPTGFRLPGIVLAAALLLSLSPGVRAETTNTPPRARLSDSFGYSQENRSEGPWAIRRVRVRRSRTDLTFHVRLGGGSHLGLATLSAQATGTPKSQGRPLAAVNGDYFVRDGAFAGDPEGLCITEGALVSLPSEKSCFWIAPDGSPRCTNVISLMAVVWPDGTRIPAGLNEAPGDRPVVFTPEFGDATRRMSGRDLVLVPEQGTASLAVGEVRGFRLVAVHEGGGTPLSATNLVVHLPESLSSRSIPPVGGSVGIDTATLPDLRGVKTALGGGPALLRGGLPTQLQAGEVRHPRTAIGWNQDDFFLLQVDGRQPSVSVGMSFAELARCFQELGCTDALNLDGGGSSTLWVQGQVANNPCEGGERPMANSLVLVLENRADPN
jgi:hypothetical protein